MVLFGFGKREITKRESAVKSVYISEAGLKRHTNEDRVFVDDERGVYAVADGVGGGSEGDKASELVCRNLKMFLTENSRDFRSTIAAVELSVRSANHALLAYREQQGYAQMASTVAVLVIDPANPRHTAVGHVGDSRIYRICRGMPELLTVDHRVSADCHDLVKAVGATERIACEWTEISGETKARYVICTDGVHDVIPQTRLAVYAAAGDLGHSATHLRDAVLKAGAPDNFSFVIVEV